MREPDFRFKKFAVWQDCSAMKVGTDSVLLGAWAQLEGRNRILDIGTGTGLLALMAAQRNSTAHITAVEIDRLAAGQAQENIRLSDWSSRITVICGDARQFEDELGFDAIICNPPYFTRSLHSPDMARNAARHNDTLSFTELSGAISRLLTADGEASLVLPTDAVADFTGAAALTGLQIHRVTDICTKTGKPPKRTLISIGKSFCEPCCTRLSIIGEDGAETREYINLVSDFYLKY